jgi:hypothetical protein
MFVYNFIDVDLRKLNGLSITVLCEMLLERKGLECVVLENILFQVESAELIMARLRCGLPIFDSRL